MFVNNMIQRGDIYYADLGSVIGSEQGGIRPVMVIQNNIGNLHSPTVIVAPITSKKHKKTLPTHVQIFPFDSGLPLPSTVLLEQVRTLDKSRLREFVHTADYNIMSLINKALSVSLGM